MSDDKNKPNEGHSESSATDKTEMTTAENTESTSQIEPELSGASKQQENLFNAQAAPKLSAPKSGKVSSGKKSLLQVIASFLAIAALVGVAWSIYSQYKFQQNWQALQAEIKHQIGQQDELTQNSQQLSQNSLQTANGNQQIINQQSILIEQLRQALTATQQKVRALSGRQKQDWLLAEAEHLIKVAQLKLTLDQDKLTAIALLKTADLRVIETADNSLLELRQVIAQDVSKLQLLKAPDISGIASQLDAIVKQIPQLELIALEFEPLEKNSQRAPGSQQEFSWSATYQNFLNDFVTIKDHSQPVKPLMTSDQRVNLNSNIQLALQQAQIALVRGEQGLYRVNLTNAINWIGEFFQHNEAAQTILNNLELLNQQIINSELPPKLAATQAIQALNQQRLYQWLDTNSGESDERFKQAVDPIIESITEPENSQSDPVGEQ